MPVKLENSNLFATTCQTNPSWKLPSPSCAKRSVWWRLFRPFSRDQGMGQVDWWHSKVSERRQGCLCTRSNTWSWRLWGKFLFLFLYRSIDWYDRISLGLIRGSLDQVDGTADITWVQPRVLEGRQLDTLAEQFKAWTESVGKTEKRVEEQAKAAKTQVLVQ